jgi:hypothetical protein
MQLTLAMHPIGEMRSGANTRLEGTILVIAEDELRRVVLQFLVSNRLILRSFVAAKVVALVRSLISSSRAPRHRAEVSIGQEFSAHLAQRAAVRPMFSMARR